jgi:uncharacterized protein YbbC (DUF1343 family)/CubicO group peptidase (beta-lactamase class C family)
MRWVVVAAAVMACRPRPDGRGQSVADAAPPLPVAVVDATPAPAAPSEPSIAAIDRVVDEAIVRGEVPGAVVVVWSHDKLVHRKAYGNRRVQPDRVAMTVDTVFDLASLTKPLATALSVHKLVADKKIVLSDPANKYIPGLDERITVEHLLLHRSGLPAAANFPDGKAIEKIASLKLKSTPGEAYLYSDLGFIVLGEIVQRVSGATLDRFASNTFYAPLGLKEISFRPQNTGRFAPTARDGLFIEGSVHDPRAAVLGGVAGHAGLFSTADDVAALGRMLLHRGELNGVRVLPEDAVAAMIKHVGNRTLGWDVHGRGFGHTGFTGTSIYVDPVAESVVVILTSRLHPDEKGDVTRLRRDVDDTARLATGTPVVLNGIDVLVRDGFARFKDKKVALVTNKSAVDRTGKRTVDVLKSNGVNVVVLFTPEHGMEASSDTFVSDGVDSKTSIPIKSLYGATKKPTDLIGADTIVFDLQDAGVRFYTYETTLGLVLESAKDFGVPVVVLDRPNPVGGAIEGPLLDEGKTSFTAYARTPIRHGMTLGELAGLFNKGATLEVVKMSGYKRSMVFADTALLWVPPSPNLRTETEALLYPGVALVEGTNVSVGRGTNTPFEVVGAPFIDGDALAKALSVPGLSFRATRFTPTASTHAGTECGGLAITVTGAFQSVRLGVAIALALKKLYPEQWQSKNISQIVGNANTVAAIERGDSIEAIVASWKQDEAAFGVTRNPYLIY